MKLRDTVILVVLAHVGLVLIWVCMGGCASNKATEEPGSPAAVSAGTEEEVMPPLAPGVVGEGTTTPITVERTEVESEMVLPEIGRTTPAAEPTETAVEPTPQEITVTVKKGDTLWALSRRYHVPISVIVDRNDIQDANMIREGRELIIPVGAAPAEEPRPKPEAPAAPTGESFTALPAGSAALPVAQDAETTLHTVESGDTIWFLARKYNTTSSAILEANNITDPTRLQIGQELHIPRGE
jgi:LysM repeat protein